jgi:site-specific recombinase XerD
VTDPAAQLLAALPVPAQRDAARGWLAECQSATTADAYARGGLAFIRWLATRGPVDLAAVERIEVSEYGASLRDAGFAPRTQAKKVAIASSLLTYAVEVGAIKHNAAKDVKRIRIDREGSTPARPEPDLTRMFRGTSSLDDVVVGLLYISAMRVTELCNADVKGLEMDDGEMILKVRIKGGKQRKVELPPRILGPLAEFVGDRKDGPLVVDRNGKRLTRNQVVYLLRRVAREVGVPNPESIRPHVLRTSFISHELAAGTAIQDVREYVGHLHSSTTELYERRLHGRKRNREIAARAAARLAGPDVAAAVGVVVERSEG